MNAVSPVLRNTCQPAIDDLLRLRQRSGAPVGGAGIIRLSHKPPQPAGKLAVGRARCPKPARGKRRTLHLFPRQGAELHHDSRRLRSGQHRNESIDEQTLIVGNRLMGHALPVDGPVAPPVSCASIGFAAGAVEAQEDMAVTRTDAGMQVDHCRRLRVRDVFADGIAKSVIGPLHPRAAIKNSVGVRVLAAVKGIRESLFSDLFPKRVQRREDAWQIIVAPIGAGDDFVNASIAGVCGQGAVEVDEIPVEIDVLLGEAHGMRKAPGIVAVKEEHAHFARQRCSVEMPEPVGLRGGAGISFDAVRAGTDDQYLFRAGVSELSDVEVERLAGGAGLFGVMVGSNFGPCVGGGRQELAARVGVGLGECGEVGHDQTF